MLWLHCPGAVMQPFPVPVSGSVASLPVSVSINEHHTGNLQWLDFHVIRRNGAVVGFEPAKIAIAMTKAFLATKGGPGAASARIRELVETLAAQAVNALVRNRPGG